MSDTTTFPTSIDSFLPVEETHNQIGKVHSAIVALETRMGLGAKVGTDISITGAVVIGGGTAYEIGALAGNIVLTFGTTGAADGDVITLIRTGTTAHTVTCINGGVGAGTMLVMPASLAGTAEFEYMNANWRLLDSTLGAYSVYATTGNAHVVAPAGGSVVTLADDVEFSGAFKPTFASAADATHTLPTTSKNIVGATGGVLSCVAAAAGSTLTLADDVEFSGAFKPTFASVADATFTLPGASCTLADAAAGLTAQKLTVTIGHADLTGAVAGAVETENIGAALAANARILGICSKLTTPFTGGGVASMDVQIGTAADIDSLIDSCDVFAAAVDGMPSTQVLGAYPFKHYAAGAQMIATFTPDGAHATADTTAGEIVIDILYTVVA